MIYAAATRFPSLKTPLKPWRSRSPPQFPLPRPSNHPQPDAAAGTIRAGAWAQERIRHAPGRAQSESREHEAFRSRRAMAAAGGAPGMRPVERNRNLASTGPSALGARWRRQGERPACARSSAIGISRARGLPLSARDGGGRWSADVCVGFGRGYANRSADFHAHGRL